uniref:mitochondrial import inner membrane translocase subunit Tim13 isoform X1 n=1 Tax=Myxine glutinosa TaxID=7769 RepID=UPI00358E95BE
MDFSSDLSSGSSGDNKMNSGALMEQVKVQIAMANVQELIERVTDKCFKKCIGKPGTSLDNTEQQRSRCLLQRGCIITGTLNKQQIVFRLHTHASVMMQIAEMPRNVHGQVHGHVEHRVTFVQHAPAKGKGSDVTGPNLRLCPGKTNGSTSKMLSLYSTMLKTFLWNEFGDILYVSVI